MSLSAQQQKDGNRKLKQWLENEKRIVTYRDISREISCHVNHAKNYHSSHQATATYILTGPLLRTSTLTYTQFPATTQAEPKATQSLAHMGGQVKIVDMDLQSDGEGNSEVDEDEDEVRMTNDDGAIDGGGLGIRGAEDDHEGELGIRGAEDDHEGELEAEETPRWGVVLVSEDGLEEKRELFEQDKLSIHVYSLSPTPVKDPGQFLLSQLSLRTNKEYSNPAIYGTITGEGFKSTEPMRDGGIDFGTASTSAAAKKKEEPVKKGKIEEKEIKASGPVKEEPKTKGKADKAVVKKPVEAAKANEEEPAQLSTKTDTKKRRSASPVKAPGKAKKAETAKAGPSSSQIKAEEQAAMEAMMEMDEDFDLDEDESGGATRAPVSVVKAEPVERKRKRRTVKKSKMEMDDKGYMVTKDYDTEESYSGESEPEQTTKSNSKAKAPPAPTKKAPPPAPSRTASTTSVESDRKPNISKTASGALKKGAGGQSTLQGFFKKK